MISLGWWVVVGGVGLFSFRDRRSEEPDGISAVGNVIIAFSRVDVGFGTNRKRGIPWTAKTRERWWGC